FERLPFFETAMAQQLRNSCLLQTILRGGVWLSNTQAAFPAVGGVLVNAQGNMSRGCAVPMLYISSDWLQ
ncbi:hypothetical protein, partial [Pseudomonas sp. Z13]|uniref:hypothetical protein n=1 Tax=Pseudomonas sp. Z13 TaxID=2983409 RepID=UPI002E809AA9